MDFCERLWYSISIPTGWIIAVTVKRGIDKMSVGAKAKLEGNHKLVEEMLKNQTDVQPHESGLDNVHRFTGGMDAFYDFVLASQKKVAKEYMDNPETRVLIRPDQTEEQLWYRVVVQGEDFILTSFDTEQEALQYIRDNNLVMADL
jgi:hypothetical protein